MRILYVTRPAYGMLVYGMLSTLSSCYFLRLRNIYVESYQREHLFYAFCYTEIPCAYVDKIPFCKNGLMSPNNHVKRWIDLFRFLGV